jgi:hypothetical protein
MSETKTNNGAKTMTVTETMDCLLDACLNPSKDIFFVAELSDKPAELFTDSVASSLRDAVTVAMEWRPGLCLVVTGTHHGSGKTFAKITGPVSGHSMTLEMQHHGGIVAITMRLR